MSTTRTTRPDHRRPEPEHRQGSDGPAVDAQPPGRVALPTAPLVAPVEVVGQVKAELWVSTDAEDTDFIVKLVDVHPDGYEAVLLDQPLRLRYREGIDRWAKVKPGETYPIEVDLWSTAQVFAPGHRIQVQVTSSDAPRFERHTNTWLPLASYDQAVKARNTVYRSKAKPSAIVLPVSR
ncbi:MAG: CocE/NonD family hydrolase [Bryobacterales bacterium]